MNYRLSYNEENLSELAKIILKRSKHRDLDVNISKLDYGNFCMFKYLPTAVNSDVLYVGVGHGHDAILAILTGRIHYAVGVDPYIESDGNGDEDYNTLLNLISHFDLSEKFIIERMAIEPYLDRNEKAFDVIVMNDVLHHIFVSKEKLSKSPLFDPARRLFANIEKALKPHGTLIVSDRERNGLRQLLVNCGLLKSNNDYSTKQSHNEWNKAATAYWQLKKIKNYVPSALQDIEWIFQNAIGRYTICDKYFLYYEKSTKSDK